MYSLATKRRLRRSEIGCNSDEINRGYFADISEIRKNDGKVYIFLLDGLGRIRWQGFGHATEEELSWLLSCTSLLLDEK
ncbi:hypothetical protein B296_00004748 [Ensete ventricosum]|uniref:Uncharacterized protein n=1 Tax=Ensete ventricosum TaxID=4639 RepID=A0A426Z4F5_ENSVE|nr:hypothetical protein B296_00004748 [Ensete ventricosum]